MQVNASHYNHVLKHRNYLLVYNSISGLESLCKINTKEEPNIEDALLRNKCIEFDSKFKFLIDNDILCDDMNEDEYIATKNLADLFDNHLNIIVMPTEQCNFRCTYCYEKFENPCMDEKMIDSLKQFLSRNISNYSAINLDWFGGEPLCNYQAVKTIMQYCRELSKKHGIPVISTMTTNGYLLDSYKMDEMLKLGIVGYQVTLDGSKKIHNMQRHLANGEGTYDTIIHNLYRIKKTISSGLMRICIRVNLNSKSLLHLDSFFRQLKIYFENDKRFTLSLRYVRDLKGDGTTEDIINDDNIMLEVYKKAEKIIPRLLTSHFMSLLDESGCCYAGKPNSFVVGSNGQIYKCTVYFKDDINKVGKLRNGCMELNYKLIAKWVYPQIAKRHECEKCWYRGRCYYGTCPYNKVKGVAAISCPFEKEYIDYILKTLDEHGLIKQISC